VLRSLTAATIAVLALAACGSSSSHSSTSPTTVAGKGGVPRGGRYVALGSSFASGPGIPVQSGGACARSDHNYPHLVASTLGLNLVDVSCSGATTANVLTTAQYGNPPQVDAVTNGTNLVTITVGGNDIGYTEATRACGASSRDCVPRLDKASMNAELAQLPARLENVVSSVRQRASGATVVLVTYPQVVPAGAQCPALNLSADEATYLHNLGERLQNVFVDVARSARVVLADAYDASVGHGPCARAGQRWVDGAHATAGYPYHPNASGHQAMAALVERALG
jgi:lysophospholipase L1-like esterase